MILDAQNQIANKTALYTGGTSTGRKFGDAIDLWGGMTIPPAGTGSNAQPNAINGAVGGSLTHDPGKGESVEIAFQVTTALTAAAGTCTLVITLVNATDEALTGSPTTLATSPTYTIDTAGANLKAGDTFRFAVELPPGATKKWLGVWMVISNEAITAGAMTVGFTPVRQATNDQTFV